MLFRARCAVGLPQAFLQHFVETDDQLGVFRQLVFQEGFGRQLQGGHDFRFQRLAPQAPGQGAHAVAQAMAFLAHGARAPVLAPQFIEDRATNAQAGIAAKRLVRHAVATQRFEQAHQADLFHVVAVDGARHLRIELAHDALHQRGIRHQMLLLFSNTERGRASAGGGVFAGAIRFLVLLYIGHGISH